MKKLLAVCSLSLLAACGASNSLKPSGELTPDQVQAAWHQAATPGDNHQALAPFVGTWKTKVTMWMDPSAKPDVSTGQSSAAWILGGRFIKENFEGNAMGQPMNGMGLMGYDNIQGKYTSVWIDSMNTAMMTSLGEKDPSGKKFEYNGTYTDPASRTSKTTRSVVTIINNNEHLFEMFEKLPNGSEFKSFEIQYIRR